MRSIDEVIKGAEACRNGDCKQCPYFPAAEVCGDQLALDLIEVVVRVKREHPDVLMTMEFSGQEVTA